MILCRNNNLFRDKLSQRICAHFFLLLSDRPKSTIIAQSVLPFGDVSDDALYDDDFGDKPRAETWRAACFVRMFYYICCAIFCKASQNMIRVKCRHQIWKARGGGEHLKMG